jgi:hypothetical protein
VPNTHESIRQSIHKALSIQRCHALVQQHTVYNYAACCSARYVSSRCSRARCHLKRFASDVDQSIDALQHNIKVRYAAYYKDNAVVHCVLQYCTYNQLTQASNCGCSSVNMCPTAAQRSSACTLAVKHAVHATLFAFGNMQLLYTL